MLSNWAFSVISEFLGLTEFVHLREVNTKSFELVEQLKRRCILTKRILAELARHLEDVPLFVQKLVESRGVISGGFLLSMCDPLFRYDDVDIYVNTMAKYPNSPSTESTTPIDKLIYFLSRRHEPPDVDVLERVYPTNVSEYRLDGCTEIMQAHTMLVDGQEFQIIELVPECDILETIHRTFDFSVLVNTWDGKHLVINDIHGISDRQISLNKTQFECASRYAYRVMKYSEKGFSFTGLHLANVTDTAGQKAEAYYTAKIQEMNVPLTVSSPCPEPGKTQSKRKASSSSLDSPATKKLKN